MSIAYETFTETADDELVESLLHEYKASADDGLGETSFDADAKMVHATLLRNQNNILDRIATVLEDSGIEEQLTRIADTLEKLKTAVDGVGRVLTSR
jgi:hypothetical protein